MPNSRVPTKPSQWGPEKKEEEQIKFLGDLPWSVQCEISLSMDTNRTFAALAGCLGYSQLYVKRLELELERKNGSPTMKLLEDWATLNPTMVTVFKYFRCAGCFAEMEIIKGYVPKEYNEIPTDPSDIDLEAICSTDDDDGSSATGGKDVSKNKLPEEHRPAMPRESSWDEFDEGEDQPREKRKVSYEFDQKQNACKLSPSAPPMEKKGDDLSLEPRKDEFSVAQIHVPTSLEKYASPPVMPDISQQLINGNSKETFKEQHESFEKLAFASLQSFSYESLVAASKNWTERIIGEGSFGTVYKMNLHATAVAVKRMKKDGVLSKASKEFNHFITEVTESRRYIHKNLISIYGYSFGPEICIIYEYMSNGSLLDRLMCKGNTTPLLWKDRISILRDAARGLNFLHVSDEKRPLIHGDIKSANILLDNFLVPKISDLGLAKHAVRANERGEYTAVTMDNTYIHGTSAYLPPSFITHPTEKNLLSIRTDVHSFGVVIGETLTGLQARTRKPKTRSMQMELLVNIIDDCSDEAQLLELLDRKPADSYPLELLLDMFQLMKQCTSSKRKVQPKMKVVLDMIKEVEVKKTKFEATGRINRLEQSAPPAISSNPLELQLKRQIDRQQANMVTSRPEHSLQPNQSFQPGIPSMNDGYGRGHPSSQAKSLPAQSRTVGSSDYGIRKEQNSLMSSASGSVDLYRSSPGPQPAPGYPPFQGIPRRDPPTPLPTDDCSIPIRPDARIFSDVPSAGQGPAMNSTVQQQSRRLPDSVPHNRGVASLPAADPEKPPIDQQRNYSLPANTNQHLSSDFGRNLASHPQNRPADSQADFLTQGQGHPGGIAAGSFQQQIPKDAKDREKMEQEKLKRKKNKPLPGFVSAASASASASASDQFSFPLSSLDSQGHQSSMGQGNDEGHSESSQQWEGTSLQNSRGTGCAKPTATIQDPPGVGLPRSSETKPDYQSLQLHDAKNVSDAQDGNGTAEKHHQSLPPGVYAPPSFQMTRTCDESDEREGHISLDDDDMREAPAVDMVLHHTNGDTGLTQGEDRLSQEFNTITVASISDSGDVVSLTSPPGTYTPPPKE